MNLNKIKEFASNYHVVFLLLIILLTIFIGLRASSKILNDDAFITYRYAENLASGLGIVYNSNESYIGTTTPFYMFILSLFYFFSKQIPSISNFIGILSLCVIEVISFKIFSRINEKTLGCAMALLISINGVLWSTLGMETLFYIMLVFLTVYFFLENKFVYVSIISALIVLTRLDGLMFVSILALVYLFVDKRKPVKEAIIFVSIASPWFIYSYFKFNSPFPNSLGAKIIQGESGLWTLSFWNYIKSSFLNDYLLFIILSVIGTMYIIKNKKHIKLLIIPGWVFTYILGYSLLGIPYYHWYTGPLVPSIFLLGLFGVLWLKEMHADIINRLKGKIWRNFAYLILIVLILVLIILLPKNIFLDSNIVLSTQMVCSDLDESKYNFNTRSEFYCFIGKWFNENTNSNSTIASAEIGILGYYSKRHIIDAVGLIQPDIAAHVLMRDADYSIEQYKPDYILYSRIFSNIITPKSPSVEYEILKEYSVNDDKWYILKRIDVKNARNITYSFLSNLPSNEISIDILNINDHNKLAMYNHPPESGESQILFKNIYIQQNAKLNFSITLDPLVWNKSNNGVEFKIYITKGNKTDEIFSKYLNPKYVILDRKWHEYQLDLSTYQMKTVDIIFSTNSRNDSTYDWAWWGDPIISSD